MPKPEGSDIIYRFGDFELSPRERILKRDGARVALTPRMFDLLRVLVEAEGRLLTKETLLDTVWADAAVEEGNLNRTISALRKALGETRNELRYIETVPKTGYRFVAAVETIVDRATVREPAVETRRPLETPATVSAPATPVRSNLPAFAAFGAFLLLFGGLTISYFVFSQPKKSEEKKAANGPSIVRLTNNGFDEDSAAWTNDNRIRFLRFPAVNRVESIVMNADGSDQKRAGGEIRDLRAGTWSPDGKRVLFSKEGIKSLKPFLANSDGSDEQQLPFNMGPVDWSGDGRQIVFSANYPSEALNSEILLYTFETGQLTNLTNSPAFDANPSFSPDGKQVIFNSDRDGNHEIYLMNVDGSGIRRLTNDPAKEAFHAFSPDGTQIVFNSNRDNEKVGIFLMNVNDDSQPVKLSDTKYNAEIRPGCWSPDGTKIVFTSDMAGEKYNVYAMNVQPYKAELVLGGNDVEIRTLAVSPNGDHFAIGVKMGDGSGELRLANIASGRMTTLVKSENYDLSPNWSPDGKTIAFAMKAEGNTEIFSIGADGAGLTNLTRSQSRDGGPVWSPDSTRILFSSDRDAATEGVHLFSMNTDGSDPRRVTGRTGYEMTPAWSPDGRTIAYACDRADGTSEALDIFIADANDPTTERILTKRRFHDSNPTFAPDGRRLAFVSQSDGNFEIYLINVDGSGLVRLTRDPGEDIMPAFSTDGSKVYFVSNRTGKFELYAIDLGAR